jgi:hypothetical protein
MSDDWFVAAFEKGEIACDSFHHADHVRLAFLYLRRFPPLIALDRFSTALSRFAAAGGKPTVYHETITWAFMLLIRERMERRLHETGRRPDWNEFAAENPDLLSWNGHVLKRYYQDETLASDFARWTFVLPDRSLNSQPHASPATLP